MIIKVLREAGYDEALLGLSLSYNTEKDMRPIAFKLAPKDGGHNKFLESIVMWLDIVAPRYWWQQFDTYRVGVTKQSESTMHTLMKREKFTRNDFSWCPDKVVEILNEYLRIGAFEQLKAMLPEGFLQRRVVCMNYKALKNMIHQRRNHKLEEWRWFCNSMILLVEHPELLKGGDARKE